MRGDWKNRKVRGETEKQKKEMKHFIWRTKDRFERIDEGIGEGKGEKEGRERGRGSPSNSLELHIP